MSKEILEDALNKYEGTVLCVSHDRYFINKTAHRILDLTASRLINYVGNYDYYLEKRETMMQTVSSGGAAQTFSGKAEQESENKLDWKEQARLRKKENDLKKCEEQIASMENRSAEIDARMSDPSIATQMTKLLELSKEQEGIRAELENLYARWESLAE